MEERTESLMTPETGATEEITELPLEEESTAGEPVGLAEPDEADESTDLILDVPEEEMPKEAEPAEEKPEEKPAITPEETARENRVREVGAKALRESLADFSRRHPELPPALLAEVEAVAVGERRRADVEFAARRDWAAKEEKERGYRDFVEQYPEIRDFEKEIPEAVWKRVRAGEGLVSAFRAHEIEQLRAELDALKTAEKNRAVSVGSVRGAGEDEYDEFLEGFLS